MRKGWIPAKLLEGGRADQRAALHVVVELHTGQWESVARLAERQPRAKPRRGGGAQLVGVEAGARSDMARTRAAVAEMKRDTTVRLTWVDPYRHAQRASAVAELDDIGVDLAMLPTR